MKRILLALFFLALSCAVSADVISISAGLQPTATPAPTVAPTGTPSATSTAVPTPTMGTDPHCLANISGNVVDMTQCTYNTGTGAVSYGSAVYFTAADVTNSTMSRERLAGPKQVLVSFLWTNAMVAALPSTAGDIQIATLPDKAAVERVIVVTTSAAVGPTTVQVSCGRVSASYTDWVLASNAKAAAIYGDQTGEQGTGVASDAIDIPSYGGAGTSAFCHFTSVGANLSTVTGSTGRVILIYEILP